jgi:hypothetical protein
MTHRHDDHAWHAGFDTTPVPLGWTEPSRAELCSRAQATTTGDWAYRIFICIALAACACTLAVPFMAYLGY